MPRQTKIGPFSSAMPQGCWWRPASSTEAHHRSSSSRSNWSVITISPANQALLGLNEPAYMPRGLNTEFAIGKVDHQINSANR